MRELWSKLRAILSGRRELSEALSEEMAVHLEFEIQENVNRGMPREDAEIAARRRFGNATLTREKARDSWGFPPIETFLQDVRYGWRGIVRSPGFSAVVILTLALGIGANTSIFSVVNRVLLQPLPFPHGERLVSIGERSAAADGFSVTWGNYLHWRHDNHSFEEMAAYDRAHFTLTGRRDAVLTLPSRVTSCFLQLLGAQTTLGRLFRDSDDHAGAPPTVVLGHDFWVEKLGGDTHILGQTLALNGKAFEVIGVLARDPPYYSKPVDFYVPLGLFMRDGAPRSEHGSMNALGLLKPGVTLPSAGADLDRIMRRLAATDPGPEDAHRSSSAFLAEAKTSSIRQPLLILLAAVGLVLAIACANVTSLILARAAARSREVAIRTAIGAGRLRILRQLLTESLLLAGFGGLAGMLIAQIGLRSLIAIGPRNIPGLAETTLDSRVLWFAAAITAFTGVLVGLAPALTSARADLIAALQELSRSATGSRRGQQFRGALVSAEIALTLVLCFGSGLLLRSLILAQTGDPGFAPDHLLSMGLVLPPTNYKNPETMLAFQDRLQADLRHLPGVTGVGVVNCPPSWGDCGDWFYSIPDRPAPARGDVPLAFINVADPTYFNVMHIPFRVGRTFSDTDTATAPRVAIVNETFARQWWPGASAVGRQIKLGGPYYPDPLLRIVGVVGDVSQMGLDSTPGPEIYLPYPQAPRNTIAVLIRSSGEPSALMNAVRRRVAALDRNLPIQSLRSFEETVGATLDRRRFSTLLLTLFAALAIVLAAVGIYGLLNYWVSVREDEIAIRQALGAQRSTILRWVGSQALRLAAAGIALGALASWWATRWIQGQVYGVSARNPATIAMAALVVLVFAALAAAIPAWRASRVDVASRLHRA